MSDNHIHSGPPPVTHNPQQEYAKRKAEFEQAFKDFHQKVFLNRTVDINKSTAAKNSELHIIDTLFKTAVALDNANVGEGILALITTAVREILTIRDRFNEFEREVFTTQRDLRIIKRELGIKDDDK